MKPRIGHNLRTRPRVKEKIQWLEPKLVCEVAFAEMTADEQLRQITLPLLAHDKKPEEVVLERT
jgi:bifunctional non-homologous end joining protein LigD